MPPSCEYPTLSTFTDDDYAAEGGAYCISNGEVESGMAPHFVTNSMTICLSLFEKEQQTGRLDERCYG